MGALGFFIVVTAFGLGVLVVESLGLLGDGESHGDDSGDDGRGAGGADTGGDYISHSSSDDDGGTDKGIALGRRPGVRRVVRGGGIFQVLFAVRMLVYFCCGFGPIGLTATLVGQSFAASATAGAGAGLVIMGIAALWIRLQRRELDSTIPDADLVGHPAITTVAIQPGATGRVRIAIAQSVIDRYAVAADVQTAVDKGERVEIVATRGADVVVRPAAAGSDQGAASI